MALKEYPRVRYGKNPLLEVICQVRFPRILTIDKEAPAEFQNEIISRYPILGKIEEIQQQVSVNITDDNPVHRVIQSENKPNYAFISEDEKWKVNLSSTFLTLATLRYQSWEDFYERLSFLIDVFHKVYSTVFPEYERIGLRYVDAFTRSELGLSGVDWSELLNPFALGFLSNADIKDDIKTFECTTDFDTGNGTIAKVKTCLGFVNSGTNQLLLQDQTPSLIVDSDIFAFKVKKELLSSKLEHAHSVATNILQSIIKKRMHEAMEPQRL